MIIPCPEMYTANRYVTDSLARDRLEVLDLDYLEETAPSAKHCAASQSLRDIDYFKRNFEQKMNRFQN